MRGTTPAGPALRLRPAPSPQRAGRWLQHRPRRGRLRGRHGGEGGGDGAEGTVREGKAEGTAEGTSGPCPPEPMRFSGFPPSGLRVLSLPGSRLGAGLLGDAPSPGVKLLCSLRRASSNKVWQGCELLRWLLAGRDVSGVEGEGIKTNKLFLDRDDHKESSSSCIFPLSYNAENYELPGTLKTSFLIVFYLCNISCSCWGDLVKQLEW